jgi:hypothetical protein
MLLETLDLRTNDVLIYSQNVFNFNDSFKIIYKNQKLKRPQRISYFDVCSFVKDPSPKNLIIYRLLTNVNNLDAYSTKYGYFIKINGKIELIYFDPIFAIKDLRHLRFDLDSDRFRFKIQQTGLTSLTKKEPEPGFAEVYNFDLKANEAQTQNDKIFADAIFAFDENFIDEELIPESNYKNSIKTNNELENDPRINIRKISEDKNTSAKELKAPNAPDIGNVQDLREEIIDLLKQALGINESQPNILVNKNNSNINIDSQPETDKKGDVRSAEVNNLFDLFKTTNKSDELSFREKDSVVLKFD